MTNPLTHIHPEDTGIITKAAQFVSALFNRYDRPYLVFHNYSLQNQTVELVKEICQAEKTDPTTQEIALLTAWFYQLGHQVDYRHAPAQSMRELANFFSETNYEEAKRSRVVSCLQALHQGRPEASTEAQIVNDAFLIAAHLLDFEESLKLLEAEHDFMKDQGSAPDNPLDQITLLEKIQLFTAYAKIHYSKVRSALLAEAHRQQQKQQRKDIQREERLTFGDIEKNGPTRGAQTLFRTNFRNHINLSAIADNKANIMISVNSILISVLITVLSYRNIGETQPMILLPVTLFLITGLASLIAAVLSARPKVTSQEISPTTQGMLKKNVIFFGTFSRLKLEDYESLMDEVLHDEALLYGNMVRDLYHLGKVLDQKYRYLSISYNIFMMGFLVTVGSFLFVLFS
ncbi:MAG TPA: Pycsar system effector family protein [Saprospiraceae bacterium]|nr:Pycsar system effector family protein [Saprospiraceae bacterium]